MYVLEWIDKEKQANIPTKSINKPSQNAPHNVSF